MQAPPATGFGAISLNWWRSQWSQYPLQVAVQWYLAICGEAATIITTSIIHSQLCKQAKPTFLMLSINQMDRYWYWFQSAFWSNHTNGLLWRNDLCLLRRRELHFSQRCSSYPVRFNLLASSGILQILQILDSKIRYSPSQLSRQRSNSGPTGLLSYFSHKVCITIDNFDTFKLCLLYFMIDLIYWTFQLVQNDCSTVLQLYFSALDRRHDPSGWPRLSIRFGK